MEKGALHGNSNLGGVQSGEALPGLLGLLCLCLSRTADPIGVYATNIKVFVPRSCKDGQERLEMLEENNDLMPPAFIKACREFAELE